MGFKAFFKPFLTVIRPFKISSQKYFPIIAQFIDLNFL